MTPPVRPPRTAIMTPPRPERPRPASVRVRRRRVVLAAVAALALVAALVLLLEGGSRPTGPATSASKHHATRPHPQAQAQATTTTTTDPVSAAMSALAGTLAGGALPGDGALASALQALATLQPGADRQASAQEALSLGQVLLNGGGITAGQYQDLVNVLAPTGVAVTPTPAPGPPQGHGHGHDQGDSGGG